MASPPQTADSPSGFEDRKSGLVVFGVLTILMGLLCALMVPLMFLGQAMAAQQKGAFQSAHTILPAAMMYGGIAVLFIWLGIGSILARRWARALLLVLSWSWLAIGVISLGFMIFLFPKIMANAQAVSQPAGPPTPPPEMTSAIMVVVLCIMGVIYVVIPAAWVLFYRSPHVKATCAARDPVERWTDRCPLPVLAVSLWLAFSCATLLLMAVVYKGVIPMFGTFVTGPLGAGLYVFMAAIFAYSARALYRLQWSGWWLVVASLCLFSVSAFLTYSRHSIDELYVLMGYSDQELAQIRQFNFLNGQTIAWFTVAGMVPFVGYMLYLRRYLPHRGGAGEGQLP